MKLIDANSVGVPPRKSRRPSQVPADSAAALPDPALRATTSVDDAQASFAALSSPQAGGVLYPASPFGPSGSGGAGAAPLASAGAKASVGGVSAASGGDALAASVSGDVARPGDADKRPWAEQASAVLPPRGTVLSAQERATQAQHDAVLARIRINDDIMRHPERAPKFLRRMAAVELAQQTDLPVAYVQDQYELVSQRYQLDSASRTIQRTPAFTHWLTKPGNAALARSDMQPLANMLWTLGDTHVGQAVGGLGWGLGASYHTTLKFLALAGGGLVSQGEEHLLGTHAVTDLYFKHVLDPLIENDAAFELGKDAPLEQRAGFFLGNAIGMLSQATLTGAGLAPAGGSLAGGVALAERSVVQRVASYSLPRIAQGSLPAVSAGVAAGERVYARTGDTSRALKAGAGTTGLGLAGALLPGAGSGNPLSIGGRLALGMGGNATLYWADNSWNNALLPKDAQQEFSWQDLVLSSIVPIALDHAVTRFEARTAHAQQPSAAPAEPAQGALPHDSPAPHDTPAPEAAPSVSPSAQRDALLALRVAHDAAGTRALRSVQRSARMLERIHKEDPEALQQLIQQQAEAAGMPEVYVEARDVDAALHETGTDVHQLAQDAPELVRQMARHEAQGRLAELAARPAEEAPARPLAEAPSQPPEHALAQPAAQPSAQAAEHTRVSIPLGTYFARLAHTPLGAKLGPKLLPHAQAMTPEQIGAHQQSQRDAVQAFATRVREASPDPEAASTQHAALIDTARAGLQNEVSLGEADREAAARFLADYAVVLSHAEPATTPNGTPHEALTPEAALQGLLQSPEALASESAESGGAAPAGALTGEAGNGLELAKTGHASGAGEGAGGGGAANSAGAVEAGAVQAGKYVRRTDISYRPATDVNATFPEGYSPPYKPGTRVTEFTSTADDVYVRVHGEDNMARSWMMKREAIEGLTPQQIQSKYALPEVPSYMSEVYVPAGTRIRTGTVNPVFNGVGNATQYELLQRLPTSAFKNTVRLRP